MKEESIWNILLSFKTKNSPVFLGQHVNHGLSDYKKKIKLNCENKLLKGSDDELPFVFNKNLNSVKCAKLMWMSINKSNAKLTKSGNICCAERNEKIYHYIE